MPKVEFSCTIFGTRGSGYQQEGRMGAHIPRYTECSQEIRQGVGKLPTRNRPTKLSLILYCSSWQCYYNLVRVYKLLPSDHNEQFHIYLCNDSETLLALAANICLIRRVNHTYFHSSQHITCQFKEAEQHVQAINT